MPKSRIRKKAAYTPPPTKDGAALMPRRWVAPVMVALFLLGLAWIVVYYVVGADMPLVGDLGNWNLLIGFGLICGGFVLSTQWK